MRCYASQIYLCPKWTDCWRLEFEKLFRVKWRAETKRKGVGAPGKTTQSVLGWWRCQYCTINPAVMSEWLLVVLRLISHADDRSWKTGHAAPASWRTTCGHLEQTAVAVNLSAVNWNCKRRVICVEGFDVRLCNAIVLFWFRQQVLIFCTFQRLVCFELIFFG